MNRSNTRASLVVVALLAGSAPLYGQSAKIVVNSTATVLVKPNAARLTFAAVTSAPGQKQARVDNDAQVARIKKAVTELALADVQMRIVSGSVDTHRVTERQRAAFGAGAPAPPPMIAETKEARTQFVVTLRDKDVGKLQENARKIADTAEQLGAIGVDDPDGPRLPRLALATATTETIRGPQIEWFAENADEARRQAIRLAINEATENARAAAGATAKLQIVEIDITTPREFATARRFVRSTDAPSAEAGSIAITAEVKVTFSYSY